MDDLLRLGRVELRNFRCFEHLSVDLDPTLTLIVADNGGGKTALLHGISACLGALFDGTGDTFGPKDVRTLLATDRTVAEQHFPCEVVATGRIGGTALEWRRALHQDKDRPSVAESTDARRTLRTLQASGGDWPITAFYGTHRAIRGRGAQKERRPQLGTRREALKQALGGASSVDQMLNWLWRAQVGTDQGKRLSAFQAVRRAVCDACRYTLRSGEVLTLDSFDIDPQSGLPVLTFSNHQRVPWDRLSDGFVTFLALVADLAWRAATLNEHRGLDAVREVCGVVLIDEVDLHLHPRWQREVLQGLRIAFPRLQFVVTTHSAQVIAAVQNDQIRVLDQGLLIADQAPVEGRDSNSILAHVMGDRSLPAWAAERMALLYRRLDDGDLPGARALLEEFRTRWGTDDVAVTKASAHLAWAEAG